MRQNDERRRIPFIKNDNILVVCFFEVISIQPTEPMYDSTIPILWVNTIKKTKIIIIEIVQFMFRPSKKKAISMFQLNTRDRNINKWKIGAPDSANRYFYCLLFIVMVST